MMLMMFIQSFLTQLPWTASALLSLAGSDVTRPQRGIALIPRWLWLQTDPGALAASLGRNLALSGGVWHEPWEDGMSSECCDPAE